MQKSNKLTSTIRKPLIDTSNDGKSTRVSSKKKRSSRDVDVGALDRLLLIRSDLANLFGQIEELVAESLVRASVDRKASQDIESFRKVLHDMQSTLKPWITKLRHSLASTAVVEENKPNQTVATQTTNSKKNQNSVIPGRNKAEVDLIVSPSPLVAWRTGSSANSCKIEDGKQLFLLTPLPKPKDALSKLPGSSRTIANANKQKIEEISLSKPPASSKTIARILHEHASKQKMEEKLHLVESKKEPLPTSTTFNVNKQKIEEKSHLVESKKEPCPTLTACPMKTSEKVLEQPTQQIPVSDDDVLKDVTSRHQDLLGTKPDNKKQYTSRRRNIDHTFDWFLSPPKTCVIMEPNDDDKAVPTPMLNGNAVSSMVTPLFKDVESTIMKGKKAGETTLKRELWARFEEASKDEVHFDKSVIRKPARMGFMDMLQEACESDCGDVK